MMATATIFLFKCSLDSSESKITIKGNLKNLPDGKMTLYQIYPPIDIDSVNTQNGVFLFSIPFEKFTESTKVAMTHQDKKGVKRLFSYSTNLKHKGMPNSLNCFLIEDGINITGILSESEFRGFTFPSMLKMVHLDRPIITGRQTQVMYNDTLGFSTITKVATLKELIEQHPYSYYYLYELKNRVANFSNPQFLSLLACFDEDVRESKTGRELKEYVLNRKTKKLDFTTTLIDAKGQKRAVLDKTATLQMVVLWASWCGPCRAEIPQLKQLYARFAHDPRFKMVSVSVDDNTANWHKALEKEQMPWTQLLITPEASNYAKELFSFNGSIPTTLFIDSQGKIVKKFVGYDEKKLEDFKELIKKYTDSNLNSDLLVNKKTQ